MKPPGLIQILQPSEGSAHTLSPVPPHAPPAVRDFAARGWPTQPTMSKEVAERLEHDRRLRLVRLQELQRRRIRRLGNEQLGQALIKARDVDEVRSSLLTKLARQDNAIMETLQRKDIGKNERAEAERRRKTIRAETVEALSFLTT